MQVRINESSREYWQNPKRYARNADELRYGSPLYYIGTAGNIVSEQITKLLVAAGAKKDWSILEVGCNCGRNMSHLAGAGYPIVDGVDINAAAAEYAWVAFPHIANRITVSDAQAFLAMKSPNSYDLIYTQSLLMHVPPEDDYLFGQIARVASKMLLISEVEERTDGMVRHKFYRNYQDVFEKLGWQQVLAIPNAHRTMRVFRK